ncbi:hypothetical protein FB45DRAFT_1115726 [Roridomyces roridus]|uniref:Uncharacterized protein n=1 Tax=Roridomyces roridus TaxID=1738132 RepID=A0AAD7FXE7_9AGAR|nr:hypothetical protein FB45DRAFT_1115726 [Roridomyces roridus]
MLSASSCLVILCPVQSLSPKAVTFGDQIVDPEVGMISSVAEAIRPAGSPSKFPLTPLTPPPGQSEYDDAGANDSRKFHKVNKRTVHYCGAGSLLSTFKQDTTSSVDLCLGETTDEQLPLLAHIRSTLALVWQKGLEFSLAREVEAAALAHLEAAVASKDADAGENTVAGVPAAGVEWWERVGSYVPGSFSLSRLSWTFTYTISMYQDQCGTDRLDIATLAVPIPDKRTLDTHSSILVGSRFLYK